VGEPGADAAGVRRADVDVAGAAQPVPGLEAADAEGAHVDRQRQRVQLERGPRPDDLAAHELQAADAVDRPAHPLRPLQRRPEQVVTVLHHLPAPAVEGGVDQRRRAGRAQQVLARRQDLGVDAVAREVEAGALLDRGPHLVHARHDEVRARVHAPLGQVGVEGQVRAPRLVDDERHAELVADGRDARDVRAGAPVGGGDEQHPLGAGVGLQRGPDVVGLRRVRQVALRVELRVHPDRPDAGDDHARDHGLVRVAGDQQLLARPGDGDHRALDGQRAAARGEEGVVRAHGVRHELLRPGHDALRLAAVVEAVEREDVRGEHLLAQHREHARVDAPALLVPGRAEDDVASAVEGLDGLQDGGA